MGPNSSLCRWNSSHLPSEASRGADTRLSRRSLSSSSGVVVRMIQIGRDRESARSRNLSRSSRLRKLASTITLSPEERSFSVRESNSPYVALVDSGL
jgi:hypothetical protein